MIQSQLNERPTLARDVRSDLPDWLDAVLMRSLAKRPGDRYQSADEFRRALDSNGALDPVAPLPDDLTVATPSSPYALRTVAARPSRVDDAARRPDADHDAGAQPSRIWRSRAGSRRCCWP